MFDGGVSEVVAGAVREATAASAGLIGGGVRWLGGGLVLEGIDTFLSGGDFALATGELSLSAYLQSLCAGGVGRVWFGAGGGVDMLAFVALSSV